MIDPTAIQNLIRHMNRWFRKRAKRRGVPDYFHRGVRMKYTATYCAVMTCVSACVFAIAVALYCVPDVTAGKSETTVLLVNLSSLGLMVLGVLILMQAFRESVIVTEDGLVRSDFLGRETRLGWNDIQQFQIKADENKVILKGKDKARLKLSLSYDGWQDFLDMAERRMNPEVFWRLGYALNSVDAKAPKTSQSFLNRPIKWLSLGRK